MTTNTEIEIALKRGRYVRIVTAVDPTHVSNNWFSIEQIPAVYRIAEGLREALHRHMGYVPADVVAYHAGVLVLPLIASSPRLEIDDDDHFRELMQVFFNDLRRRAQEIAGDIDCPPSPASHSLSPHARQYTTLKRKTEDQVISDLSAGRAHGVGVTFPTSSSEFASVRLPSVEAIRCHTAHIDEPRKEIYCQITGFDHSQKAVICDGNKLLFGLPDASPETYPIGTQLWVSATRRKPRTLQIWTECEVLHAPQELRIPTDSHEAGE